MCVCVCVRACVHWCSVYTGVVCTLVECVHWWSVYTGGVCTCTVTGGGVCEVWWWSVHVVCTLVECVKCVHWWSLYTGVVCTHHLVYF